MTDPLTPEQRRRAMTSVKLKNGRLEVAVCSALKQRGFRFKKHVKSLPGSPDVVFPSARLVVFIDGDFWHGYRLPSWEHKLSAFWRKKLYDNRRRDERNFRRLRAMGWRVVRLWQHQIERDLDSTIEKIIAELES